MNTYSPVRVGVAGVTGYAGLELLRRLARHPKAVVRMAMASGASEAQRLPALAKIWDAPVEPLNIDRLATETDAVFLALPDTLAAEIAPVLADRGTRVFDLSGAFRLRDIALRARWYPHTGATSVPIVYGLTERHRLDLANAKVVACAGCYPTAAILPLQPLVAASL